MPDPEASFIEDTGRNLAAAFNPDWIGKDPTEDDAVAAKDRTIRPGWQRRMARERLGVEPIELPTGHCPNVSQPRRLAELLVEVAERA